ncbi:flagellar biosynthesis anti-sigma factor FlgM [Spirochaeta lutea]|uniref:Flagellar biosynthesis anti-sigma factor FlgM n=1 Tax=Spirochaeta lutea TaxID=1480694 RepID=A0A098QVH0_9SPIO|nr:flagellar biosynthesis anti-sigma factor FlgM [Spirochaeta lutea]KGE71586.1 flagellar biosynthesis anti-sigma factor FlgM [Spirochaeta lutea]
MSIERLGPLDPISTYNKNQKTQRVQRENQSDSVSVSNEARTKAELLKLDRAVREADDIRADKVDEIKKKLQDPSYIDEKMIDEVADRLLELFGIE